MTKKHGVLSQRKKKSVKKQRKKCHKLLAHLGKSAEKKQKRDFFSPLEHLKNITCIILVQNSATLRSKQVGKKCLKSKKLFCRKKNIDFQIYEKIFNVFFIFRREVQQAKTFWGFFLEFCLGLDHLRFQNGQNHQNLKIIFELKNAFKLVGKF